jgi:hypothetical protein
LLLVIVQHQPAVLVDRYHYHRALVLRHQVEAYRFDLLMLVLLVLAGHLDWKPERHLQDHQVKY